MSEGAAATRPRIEDAVVVLTGATSGIGRAAALRFARRGARLGLIARGSEELEALAEECRALGTQAVFVAGDVGDEAQVRAVAAATEDRFGGLDVWVNCAGVIAYWRFEDIPTEVFARIIQTNLMGQVHGARAALERFRAQGHGVLINLSSVWGRVTSPHVSGYVTSKTAVRAFSECLRHELEDEPGIDVATILPQAVDTPIFDAAANYSGRRVRPIPPLETAEEVAKGILACAEDPRREVTYGRAGRLLELAHAFAPRLYCRVGPRMFTRGSFGAAPAPAGGGRVVAHHGTYAVEGGWRGGRRRVLRRALFDAVRGAAQAAFGRRAP